MAAAGEEQERRRPAGSLIAELGLVADLVDDELHGRSPVVREMLVPTTDCLRISVLAAWADTLIGFQAIAAVTPQVPVTIDLSIDLHTVPRGVSEITGHTSVLKAGSSVVTAEVAFAADGRPVGHGEAAFMAAPGGASGLPPMETLVAYFSRGVTVLDQPYAERAGCRRESPGVASLTMTRDKLNAAGSVNGGLLAIVIEEAILSATADCVVTSLAVRYLRAGRTGPFVATAEIIGDLARVQVRDAGADERLVVVATARLVTLRADST